MPRDIVPTTPTGCTTLCQNNYCSIVWGLRRLHISRGGGMSWVSRATNSFVLRVVCLRRRFAQCLGSGVCCWVYRIGRWSQSPSRQGNCDCAISAIRPFKEGNQEILLLRLIERPNLIASQLHGGLGRRLSTRRLDVVERNIATRALIKCLIMLLLEFDPCICCHLTS